MEKFKQIVDFIKEIYDHRSFIPLHEPLFFGNEKKYLEECIDSTFVSSVGPFVGKFEDMVADFVSSGNPNKDLKAIACVNGTSALHLALILVGVKASDQVITQPLSFIATANAISYTGAEPLFIDVDEDSLGLSPSRLSKFLEENCQVKGDFCYNNRTGQKISACIPMHSYGNPCRIDLIVKICSRYNIAVVEDAAESLGSFYKGKHTGTFGDIGVFSFNGNKTITTGGGGILLVKDNEVGIRAKHLSTQAKVNHPFEFYHDEIGYNYRMPNINAAIGVAQMENLDLLLKSKKLLATKYNNFFSDLGFNSIREIDDSDSNYWLNGFFAKDRNDRDRFLEYSIQKGIHCRPAWTILSNLPMFSKFQKENIFKAEKIGDTLINVPSFPPHRPDDPDQRPVI